MIWITGNKGMLGRELGRVLESAGLPFVGSDKEVSILDPAVLRTFADSVHPAWIINCSAYTAVDKAETDRDAAFAINRDGVANLARLAGERDIPLIHISTDYVFDGTSSIPLSEEASTGPQGIYGVSKLAGEEALRKLWPKHFILRTAWLYGQFGPNFVYTMLKLMDSRESIKVVNDQHGSPTWTADLAGSISRIIQSESTDFGTYHYSGGGECTWFEFAGEIYRLGQQNGLISSDCRIEPCSSDEFPAAAKRPEYSLLSKDKIRRIFSVEIADWRDSLNSFLKGISKNDII